MPPCVRDSLRIGQTDYPCQSNTNALSLVAPDGVTPHVNKLNAGV
jgi:hypothetical protein